MDRSPTSVTSLWDAVYEAVQDGGAGHTEPEDYYEGVTDAVVKAIMEWLDA